jgi:hypothetical protein
MQPERSQEAAPLFPLLSYMNTVHTLSLISILLLSSHQRHGLERSNFRLGFTTKIMYKFIISSVRATCPVHLILLNLITLLIFNGGQELWSFSLCCSDHINNNINLNESHNSAYIPRNLAQRVTLFWLIFEKCTVRMSVGSSTILLDVPVRVNCVTVYSHLARSTFRRSSSQHWQLSWIICLWKTKDECGGKWTVGGHLPFEA